MHNRYLCGCLAAFLAGITACSDTRSKHPAIERVQAASSQSLSISFANGDNDYIRLAGVQMPYFERFPQLSKNAQQALKDQITQAHTDIKLIQSSDLDRDRYNRLIASIEIEGKDLGAEMIAQGHMMVWPAKGERVDYASYYAQEDQARRLGKGAWAGGGFKIMDTDPDHLAQWIDSPVIVQGYVIATGKARDGRVFLNFGLDWSRDFTVVIDPKIQLEFDEKRISLTELEGAEIRVRGWLVEQNGPALWLNHSAQLEIIDAPPMPSLPG